MTTRSRSSKVLQVLLRCKLSQNQRLSFLVTVFIFCIERISSFQASIHVWMKKFQLSAFVIIVGGRMKFLAFREPILLQVPSTSIVDPRILAFRHLVFIMECVFVDCRELIIVDGFEGIAFIVVSVSGVFFLSEVYRT